MRDEFMEVWSEYCRYRDSNLHKLRYSDQRTKLILALWARINALCDDTLFLVGGDRSVSLQILMRSTLETFVDLRCLLIDEEHVDCIFASEADSEYKNLSYYDADNPYYSHTSRPSDEVLGELRDEKKKSLSIYDRFKKAECGDLYRTVYNNLCRYTHGNVSALASKNFEDDKIVIHTSIVDTDLVFTLSSTINVALSSTIDVFELFEIDSDEREKCANLHARVKELCKKFV